MRRILLSLSLLLTVSLSANAQTVSVPNTFADGTPALASEVNANFDALESAVNSHDTRITAAQSAVNGISCATAADVVCNPSAVSCPACPSCPAAPACDTLGSYNQGFTDGGNGVDITSDNAAIAAAAGNAACAQAGGTWEAGTSTCTPAPAASSYNCFVAGFCAQAAIDFPPGDFGYTNVYEGHTQGTEPALGAGCNLFPGSASWADGSFSRPGTFTFPCFGSPHQCRARSLSMCQ